MWAVEKLREAQDCHKGPADAALENGGEKKNFFKSII